MLISIIGIEPSVMFYELLWKKDEIFVFVISEVDEIVSYTLFPIINSDDKQSI